MERTRGAQTSTSQERTVSRTTSLCYRVNPRRALTNPKIPSSSASERAAPRRFHWICTSWVRDPYAHGSSVSTNSLSHYPVIDHITRVHYKISDKYGNVVQGEGVDHAARVKHYFSHMDFYRRKGREYLDLLRQTKPQYRLVNSAQNLG